MKYNIRCSSERSHVLAVPNVSSNIWGPGPYHRPLGANKFVRTTSDVWLKASFEGVYRYASENLKMFSQLIG